MSEFVVRVETGRTPADAWRRLWDLDRHTAVTPLTTVRLLPPARTLEQGATFCARTAVGRWGFDDTMRVLDWQPPTTGDGRAAVLKTGLVIGGRIDAVVEAVGAGAEAVEGGAAITWRQQVVLPWLPSSVSWLEHLAARLVSPGYRAVLRRLLA